MSNIQKFAVIFAAAALTTTSVVVAAPPPITNARIADAYTASTAPDETSRAILESSLHRLDQGAKQYGSSRMAIHHNFPQLIEQNFARMDSTRLTRFLTNAQPAELSDMAQLYVNAASDRGISPRLLDVLAVRATARQLGKLSEHFGYNEIYASIARRAPEKIAAYTAIANAASVGPVPGQARFGPMGRSTLAHRSLALVPENANLDYTIYETYLSFRTAPIGSMSVAASMFSTATVWGTHLGLAWNLGYSIIGPAIGSMMQTYAPSLYDSIGSGINWYIEALTTAPSSAERATVEEQGADMFQLGPISQIYEATGGDFGVTMDWYDYGDWGANGGGGGGAICYSCILM